MPTEHPVDYAREFNLTDTGSYLGIQEMREYLDLLSRTMPYVFAEEQRDRILVALSIHTPLIVPGDTDIERALNQHTEGLYGRVYGLRAMTNYLSSDAEHPPAGLGGLYEVVHIQAGLCLQSCSKVTAAARQYYALQGRDDWAAVILAAPRDTLLGLAVDYPRFRLFATLFERHAVLEAFAARSRTEGPDRATNDLLSGFLHNLKLLANGRQASADPPLRAQFTVENDFLQALARHILYRDLGATRRQFAERRALAHAAGLGRLRKSCPFQRLGQDVVQRILRLLFDI